METFIQDALPKDGNYVPDGKMALPHRRTSKIWKNHIQYR